MNLMLKILLIILAGIAIALNLAPSLISGIQHSNKGHLYWSTGADIFRASLDGRQVQAMHIPVISGFRNLVFDSNTNSLFGIRNGIEILRYEFVSKKMEVIVDYEVLGVEWTKKTINFDIDRNRSKLYWVEEFALSDEDGQSRLLMANGDGSDKRQILDRFERPRAVAINRSNSKLILSGGNKPGLWESEWDGTDLHHVLVDELVGYDYTVDGRNNQVYWNSRHNLWKINLDGTNKKVIAVVDLDAGTMEDSVVDLERNKAYWIMDCSRDCGWRFYSRPLDSKEPPLLVYETDEYVTELSLNESNGKLLFKTPNRIMELNPETQRLETLLLGVDDPRSYSVNQDANKLYFTSSGELLEYNIAQSSLTVLSKIDSDGFDSVYDAENHIIFWLDTENKIHRYDFMSETYKVVAQLENWERSNQRIAVDAAYRRIYWSEKNAIYQASYDGSATGKILMTDGLVGTIDFDPIDRKVYWAEQVPKSSLTLIRRANIDGSELEIFIETRGRPEIAVDYKNRKMYLQEYYINWIEWTAESKFLIANLDGSDLREFLGFDGGRPMIVVYN